jgi:hypothetical protein
MISTPGSVCLSELQSSWIVASKPEVCTKVVFLLQMFTAPSASKLFVTRCLVRDQAGKGENEDRRLRIGGRMISTHHGCMCRLWWQSFQEIRAFIFSLPCRSPFAACVICHTNCADIRWLTDFWVSVMWCLSPCSMSNGTYRASLWCSAEIVVHDACHWQRNALDELFERDGCSSNELHKQPNFNALQIIRTSNMQSPDSCKYIGSVFLNRSVSWFTKSGNAFCCWHGLCYSPGSLIVHVVIQTRHVHF